MPKLIFFLIYQNNRRVHHKTFIMIYYFSYLNSNVTAEKMIIHGTEICLHNSLQWIMLLHILSSMGNHKEARAKTTPATRGTVSTVTTICVSNIIEKCNSRELMVWVFLSSYFKCHRDESSSIHMWHKTSPWALL